MGLANFSVGISTLLFLFHLYYQFLLPFVTQPGKTCVNVPPPSKRKQGKPLCNTDEPLPLENHSYQWVLTAVPREHKEDRRCDHIACKGNGHAEKYLRQNKHYARQSSTSEQRHVLRTVSAYCIRLSSKAWESACTRPCISHQSKDGSCDSASSP